jgi:hypothetical protein
MSSSVLGSPPVLELEEDLLPDMDSLGLVERLRFCFRLPLERPLLLLFLWRERLLRVSASEFELSSIVLSSELSVWDLRLLGFFDFFFPLAGLLCSCLLVLKAWSTLENDAAIIPWIFMYCKNSHMTL